MLALAALVVAGALANPADVAGSSKKEAYLAAKRGAPPRRADCCAPGFHLSEQTCSSDPACRRARKAGDVAETVRWARNLHTEEVMPWTGPTVIDRAAIARFTRCHFTDEPSDHPEPLLRRVLTTAEHFEARQIHIVSGYRHPKYNRNLIKKGREVAKDSQHTRSQAIDFSLPGVKTAALYKYLRKQHPGGVGYYPVSSFVHVDTGERRTWKGT